MGLGRGSAGGVRLRAGHPAALAYDRIRDRAWNLALNVTHDQDRAADVIVAVFDACACDPQVDWNDDVALLRDVRRRALVAMEGSTGPSTALATELAHLTPVQREAVELAVIGGCTPAQIARALGAAPNHVTVQLTAGIRALAASVGRGVQLQV
ncbi:MAG: hypothetical protein JWN72_1126 [Thermoleophilia bacterium]|nr:hypothetical protein [Thermoleophilia bacterium]